MPMHFDIRLVAIWIVLLSIFFGVLPATSIADKIATLMEEVKTKGWIVFPARSDKGDWDLYRMRPDGSQRRNMTNTPEANESYPLFSRDGTRWYGSSPDAI